MLEFKLPEVGENIESGNVVSIAVSVGDTVTKDQDLLELETDKASLPVPSPVDGLIEEILIKEGDDVKIGQVVMKIAPTSADAQPEDKAKEEAKPSPKKNSRPEAPQPAPQPAPQVTAKTLIPNESIPEQSDVPAAPSVRRLARELGIVISQVSGTSKGGRVSEDDVKAYAKGIITGAVPAKAAGIAAKPLPDFSKWGEVKREAMSKIRTVTAEHLSFCWQTIPHVTQFGFADITELEKFRKKHSTKKAKLTVTPFILKVMAAALKAFPQFNVSVDMSSKEIITKNYINLGVAVDTERGLMVPVIRDVDQKSIVQINKEVVDIAAKARDRKISLEELKGGCMTLTNLGGVGGTSFTPIVNWPEVAILGVSRGGWEAVYENDQFIPRFKLPLSLSYDHRIIDGAAGARFLKWICDEMEQPFNMESKK